MIIEIGCDYGLCVVWLLYEMSVFVLFKLWIVLVCVWFDCVGFVYNDYVVGIEYMGVMDEVVLFDVFVKLLVGVGEIYCYLVEVGDGLIMLMMVDYCLVDEFEVLLLLCVVVVLKVVGVVIGGFVDVFGGLVV